MQTKPNAQLFSSVYFDRYHARGKKKTVSGGMIEILESVAIDCTLKTCIAPQEKATGITWSLGDSSSFANSVALFFMFSYYNNNNFINVSSMSSRGLTSH